MFLVNHNLWVFIQMEFPADLTLVYNAAGIFFCQSVNQFMSNKVATLSLLNVSGTLKSNYISCQYNISLISNIEAFSAILI